MGIEGSGATRAGGDGLHNEDTFLVQEGIGLYLVCDGASNTAAGEVAARTAMDAVEELVRSHDDLDVRNARVARFLVEKALKRVLAALVEVERSDPRLRGLSTTITFLLAHGHRGIIGHRGDSRAYLIRRGRGDQLTVDHELTDPVANEPGGSGPFDVFAVELLPNDMIILCTDGAEQVVEDTAIIAVAADLSPRLLASRIVSAAHRRDAALDATAVVVRVRGDSEPGWLELSQPPRGTAFGHTLELS